MTITINTITPQIKNTTAVTSVMRSRLDSDLYLATTDCLPTSFFFSILLPNPSFLNQAARSLGRPRGPRVRYRDLPWTKHRRNITPTHLVHHCFSELPDFIQRSGGLVCQERVELVRITPELLKGKVDQCNNVVDVGGDVADSSARQHPSVDKRANHLQPRSKALVRVVVAHVSCVFSEEPPRAEARYADIRCIEWLQEWRGLRVAGLGFGAIVADHEHF